MSRASMEFEAAVRRAAEAVWRLEPGACEPQWYTDDPDLHELDGLAELRDITHVIMATTDTRLEKVKSDVMKLNAATRLEAKRGVPVEKWLISERQLSAEHLKHARKNGVKILTLDQFTRRFFDGRDYLAKRRRAPFGSARNLGDGSITIPEDEYVELPIVEIRTAGQDTDAASGTGLTVGELARRVADGDWFVMIGPFGAGKSLTTREVFYQLAKRGLRSGESGPIPIAVNLREHWGAMYADEVLERHARSSGFLPKEDLTVAWRAGIAVLLLDGFDEMASQVIAQPSDRNWMSRARFDALVSVRDLVRNLPAGAGLLICGRDHYFDDLAEMSTALGLTGRRFSIVRLDEFTEDQAARYLSRRAPGVGLPDWLPRKPLILGYLAHRGLLEAALLIDGSRGFGFVWDSFLDLICQREAEHAQAVMDPTTVRRVLERLATGVRSTVSGAGPMTAVDIAEAYRTESGQAPGEGVLMQLQRLPGLTPRDHDPSARAFVDQDLLAALQGSAVARAIFDNSSAIVDRRWLDGLRRDGVRMASHMLREWGFKAPTVLATAARFAEERTEAIGHRQLAADCFAIALEMARDDGELDARGLTLEGVVLADVNVEELVIVNLSVRQSIVETLTVGPELLRSSLRFEGTHFGRVLGVPSQAGLPRSAFIDCSFSSFDDASTNAAILQLDIQPTGVLTLTQGRRGATLHAWSRRSYKLRLGLGRLRLGRSGW